jgi:hypothetical protein
MSKTTWEAFFDEHAPLYEENIFTKNTVREVDFLLEELARGYAVTGVDLSSAMLARAADAARAAGAQVQWLRVGARHVGRNRGELGEAAARSGRDRDHDRGAQDG